MKKRVLRVIAMMLVASVIFAFAGCKKLTELTYKGQTYGLAEEVIAALAE